MENKCQNCKNGIVDGGAHKKGREPKRTALCFYCKGTGFHNKWARAQ